jgi:hypothetical protein
MDSKAPAPKALFAHIKAYPIALLGSPVSADAVTLVDYLMDHVVLVGPGGDRRPTSVQRTRRALGALLADLFDLQRGHADDPRPRLAAHGMSPKDFPAKKLGFGRDIFAGLMSSLKAVGLLSVAIGQPRLRKAFGKVHNFNGQVTTFQVTPDLIDLATSIGVEVADWKDHWRSTDGKPVAPRPNAPRVELRGRKVRVKGKKQDAPILPVDVQDPRVRELLAGVHKVNGFMAQQEIGGIAFPGLRRIFNDGDQPDFAWNKGGRFYSLAGGHRYETMSADRRLERITFNGERVGEADIRASHLTLLHALLDRPFDPTDDPYEVDGIDNRTIIKWWCTQALGSSNPKPRQWASDKKDVYAAITGGS